MSKVRGGDGRYGRDPNVAERDARACELRTANLTYAQIGVELGISKVSAYESVQRALKETVQEPADEVRQLELLRLDELARQARKVMLGTHYVVDKGAVVLWEDEPLIDDAPVLAAVDRLLKVQERRAKLLGIDSPQRVSIDAQQIGDDIRDLIAALATGSDDPDDDDDGA